MSKRVAAATAPPPPTPPSTDGTGDPHHRFSRRVFDTFNLRDSTFDRAAIETAFAAADHNGDGVLDSAEVLQVVVALYQTRLDEESAREFTEKLVSHLDSNADGVISKDEFVASITTLASQVDKRVWPVAGATLLTGLAVGVVIPVMPVLITTLGISSAQFGGIISAMAVGKLLGNIPFGIVADRYGRKPFLVLGLGLMAFSSVGISLASSFEHLVLARLVTGFGIASFVTASTLYLTDLSTPLNRARTLAPSAVAFSAGTMLGPAIGGVLADALGLFETFLVVGSMFGASAAVAHFSLADVYKPPPLHPSVSQVLADTSQQWRELLAHQKLRQIFVLNALYWVAISGSQFTILPLMLVEDLHLSASQIGFVYAGVSVVNVLGGPPVAWAADRYGSRQVIIPGCLLLVGSQAAFPLLTAFPMLAFPALGVWALASTMLNTTPTAYTADVVPVSHRSQALALLRTSGDFGMLLGASESGVVAEMSSHAAALHVNAATLLLGTLAFSFNTRPSSDLTQR